MRRQTLPPLPPCLQYWGRRPVAVAARILQLLSISSGFLSGLALDWFKGDLAARQVQRAIELRNIMTSLGPAYIKLGQALSIRPDLLSPAAMNEMQKLCDKVPSYDSVTAMKLIEEELGPWQDIYSQLRSVGRGGGCIAPLLSRQRRSTHRHDSSGTARQIGG